MMNENVKIPLTLLNQTVELLEQIDVSGYENLVLSEYEPVLSALRKKQQSLALRRAYAKIIFAKDENERFEARMRYLQQKRDITNNS